MSSRVSAEPVRTCVGCRTRRPTSELLRIVRTDDGILVGGPSSGRGAWVCRRNGVGDARCVEAAIRKGGFARAWRSALAVDELDAVREAVAAGRTDRSPD